MDQENVTPNGSSINITGGAKLFLEQSLTPVTNETYPFAMQDGSITGTTAAIIMVLMAFIGFSSNITAVVFCLNMKSLHNPFCLLFVSTACSDCGVLAAFGLWAAPLLLTHSTLALSRVGKVVSGFLILPCWIASVVSTMSIAINRYIAVAAPQHYADIYTMRNVFINIVITWLVGVAYGIPFSLDGCEMYFDPIGYFAYHYTTQSTCGLVLDYICSAICCAIFIFILSINIATFVKMRQVSKVLPAAALNNARQVHAKNRREKEMSFFVQACLNNVIFEIVMIFYHTIFPHSLAGNFVIKTFVWELGHTANGFIFLYMNKEARYHLLRKFFGGSCVMPDKKIDIQRPLQSLAQDQQHQDIARFAATTAATAVKFVKSQNHYGYIRRERTMSLKPGSSGEGS